MGTINNEMRLIETLTLELTSSPHGIENSLKHELAMNGREACILTTEPKEWCQESGFTGNERRANRSYTRH